MRDSYTCTVCVCTKQGLHCKFTIAANKIILILIHPLEFLVDTISHPRTKCVPDSLH